MVNEPSYSGQRDGSGKSTTGRRRSVAHAKSRLTRANTTAYSERRARVAAGCELSTCDANTNAALLKKKS